MASRKLIVSQLRFWQFVLPFIMLIWSVYLIVNLEYPLAGFTDWLLWISRLDPLLLFAYSGASHTLPFWGWLPVGVLLVTAFAGRIFCGWLCPVGGLLELLSKLSGNGRRPGGLAALTRRRLPALLARLKYGWLLIVLILLFAGSSVLLIFTPLALLSHELMRLYTGEFPWLLIAVLGSGILLFPRFWCTYICPSGLLLSAVAGIRPVRLRIADGCTGCGLCRSVCPVTASQGKQGTMGAECLLCGRCWSICPTRAITCRPTGYKGNGINQTRRDFITLGLGIIGAGLLSLFTPPLLGGSRASAPVLRPPGALPEGEFLATCNRCGRCVKVCPSEGLVPMPIERGLMTFATPRLVPRKGRCELCMLCPKVCPTGALQDIAVEAVRLGTAAINRKTCLAWNEGKLCLICAEQCPVHAVALDGAKRPEVTDGKCIGCGACENSCPVEEPAVVVTPKNI